MPIGTCVGCGRTTNSATSNWWRTNSDGVGAATECYAAFVNGQWIRGCAYARADPLTKGFVDKLIKAQKRIKQVYAVPSPDRSGVAILWPLRGPNSLAHLRASGVRPVVRRLPTGRAAGRVSKRRDKPVRAR